MTRSILCATLLSAGALFACPASAAEKEAPPPSPHVPEAGSPTPSPHSTEADRQRFMNLSDKAREKFIEIMRENRDKMINATPEERGAFAKEAFDKVAAEDRAERPQPSKGPKPGSQREPVTGQRQPLIPPSRGLIGASPPRVESKLLSRNYRITLSGKEVDRISGALTSLTCASTIQMVGTLEMSDRPTLISLTGDFTDEHGSITLNYLMEFDLPVPSSYFARASKDGGEGSTTVVVSYKSQTCQGALRMMPGKTYEVLKARGITYSVSIAPEPDK